MDKAGLLLLSSPNRVTIGLLSWDGPGKGLRLLLRDTDHFSSQISGTFGMQPRLGLRASSEATSACEQAVYRPASLCLYSLLTRHLHPRPVLPGRGLGTPSSSR